MTKETKKILSFIESDETSQAKLKELSESHTNFKDFYNQTGYVIMDIVNTNKDFHNLSRNNIEIDLISERYFG